MNLVEIWHQLRFHTTFTLHMFFHKLGWYKKWHTLKWHRHAHVGILLIYILSVVLGSVVTLLPKGKALASATFDWNLNTSTEYTYDSNKVEFAGGVAQLKAQYAPGSNWIATDSGYNWNYRKAIDISNPNNSSEYQVQLTGVNTTSLVGKMQSDCADIRFTNDDGVTSIPYWIESTSCPSTSTTIWVKVPATKTRIYMYYGSSKPEWTPRDSNRWWSLIASSSDGTKLAGGAWSGQMYTSTDSGVTWTPRDSARNWYGIASSSDGTKLAATVGGGGQIYTSTDSGATWTPRDSNRNWNNIVSSSDGTKLASVVSNGQIYTSTDSGVTWTPHESNRNWRFIASSSDGTRLAAAVWGGQIYTSTDSGATWTPHESNRNWNGITSSADGTRLAAIVTSGQIYTSTDSGATWTPHESNRNWNIISASDNGNKLIAGVGGGQIYISTDSGVTWSPKEQNRNWSGATMSSDGTKLVATDNGGYVYTSNTTNSDTNTFINVIPSAVAVWPMNEASGTNVADLAQPPHAPGSPNDATNTSGTGIVAGHNGGWARSFSGQNPSVDKISRASNSTLDTVSGSGGKITITAWAYMTTDNAQMRFILEKGDNAANNYRFRINGNNTLNFSWQNPNGTWVTYPSTGTVGYNAWQHLAVSVSTDASGVVSGTFYINGSSAGTFASPSGKSMLSANGKSLNIGYGEGVVAANSFLGTLDEPSVYMGILTLSQIQALAASDNASYFSQSSHPGTEYIYKYAATAPSGAVGSEISYYPSDAPTVTANNSHRYNVITAFTQTPAENYYITYQLSNDDGINWYWFDASGDYQWHLVTDPNNANYSTNIADLMSGMLPQFTGNATIDGHTGTKQFKWKAFLYFDGYHQTQLDNVQITIKDTVAPNNISSLNGLSGLGGTAISSGEWHNYAHPAFTWSAPSDNADTANGETASGIYSYWFCVSTDPNCTPDFYASSSQTEMDYGGTLTTGNTYYVRAKTIDADWNESATDTLFTYKYDATKPTQPGNLHVNTLQPSEGPFSFNWTASTDPIPQGGEASGVDHYEYTIWNSNYTQHQGPFITTSTSLSDIAGYYDGDNIFTVEAVDVAGNASDWATVTFNYVLNTPSEPLNLSVSPQDSTTNNFTFTWGAPVTVYAPATLAGYKYSVNNLPSANNVTDVSNVLTTGSIHAATQQGVNRFYVVAYDSLGRVNYSKYAWVDFNVNTMANAPTAPQNVVISDVSDRHKPDHYALALSWKPPDNYSASTFGHYSIRRTTTSGLTDDAWKALTPVGTASTPAYAEANLTKNQMYYYRISGVDNAGAEANLSSVVSLAPTGKYIEVPKVVSGPSVSATATSAVITWSTDRDCYSKVEYGKGTDYGMQNSSLQKVTAHSITLYGLDPGTTYHYRAQSLDPADQKDYDDNLAYSSDITFATQPAPGISDVKISDISLSGAIVSWKTTSSATSTIRYGKSNAYGSELSDTSGSAVTTHTVKLSGLSDSSTYHFKIFGTDTDGNIMQSDDYNFDTLTFPKISNVKSEQLKGNGSTLKITWESNVPVSSTVVYSEVGGSSQEVSKADLILKHELIVPKLKDNTEYNITVKGRDAYGNEGTSESLKIKTDYDTTPPSISDITTETSMSGYGLSAKAQMIVSWNTDEPSTSQVEYAKGVSGDTFSMTTKEDSNLTTSHVVVVSDLDPSSSYYFRVVSKDNSKNEAKSETNSALTEEARSSIFDIVIKSFESTLGWLFGG